MKEKTNLTMLCDFYELTMGNGYFQTGLGERICYFDVFFRSVPDQGGFAIAAGLAQVIEYIQKLRFDEEDIAYLRSKGCFAEPFLDYLRQFRFTGDIWAVPEGTPIFPGEPILTVRAPAIQAQFIETFVLLCLNHQSLIATKSNRIVRAAEGRPIFCFLHYPPLYQGYQCPEILSLLEAYKVELCCYGHLHGPVIRRRQEGKYGNTEFSLISGDYLGFVPKKICEK